MGGLVTAGPRVALVGAGVIAPFHVDALRSVGFVVDDVAGRPGSERAPRFADDHGIGRCWDDPSELLADDGWDVAVVAAETGPTLDLMVQAASSGRPVLVEKPVVLRPELLEPHRDRWPNVIVAYNRRHYEPVAAAREFAERHGPCSIHLTLPDFIDREATGFDRTVGVRLNSVHGFDLLRFVAGEQTVVSVVPAGDGDDDLGRTAVLRSERGHATVVELNWGAAANFGLTLSSAGRRFALVPFEHGRTFEGMEVVEPTPETPVRSYRPVVAAEHPLGPESLDHKPGFVAQARALMGMLDGRDPGPASARLVDAYEAAHLADQLLDGWRR